MSRKITMTVDGRSVTVEAGTMLLTILQEMGIPIPTLCHHPSLTPNGACRLCLVEIARPEWQGWSRLVTSCLYPAEEGLQVLTRSERVREARRTQLELYLAHNPDSEEIRELAASEGVDTTPFRKKSGGDNCVLCGLCTRVCQELGPSAIASLGRGIEKIVGPGPDLVGEDCTGCGACAYVCPTNAIPAEVKDKKLTIWNREFAVPVCSVNADYCRGCGRCREVCPLSIPRVSMSKSGTVVSYISYTECVGCGMCAGACPTGAIVQEQVSPVKADEPILTESNLKGRVIVFACSRSPLPENEKDTVRVSCIGSVPVDTILGCLARGADGVILMCRDKATCPFGQGGAQGENQAAVAGQLALSAGLGENRVVLINPAPGLKGPTDAVVSFREKCKPTPLNAIWEPERNQVSGLDRALDIMQWFKTRAELTPVLPQSIKQLFDDISDNKDTLFYLGMLPELDLLLSLVIKEWRVSELIHEGVALLQKMDCSANPVFTRQAVDESSAIRVIVFDRNDIPAFERSVEIVTLDELSGIESIPTTEVSDFSIRISAKEREKLIARVRSASPDLLCATALEYIQYKLLLRDGAWRQDTDCRPAMAFFTKTETPEEEYTDYRIHAHPILKPPEEPASVVFTFNGQKLVAQNGEMISSALYAHGLRVFGHHHKDGAAQGIYCANGQCSQCMVIVDGKPVKGCMEPVRSGMVVQSCDKKPSLPSDDVVPVMEDIPTVETECLIIGGGPAGLSAAIEMAKYGVRAILADDKHELGGKLTLQTHNFFGSRNDCYAGTRGIDIATLLEDELSTYTGDLVDIWLNSPATGIFCDGNVGIVRAGKYVLVKPDVLLVAAGAREKTLAFPGCDLPGVYGAGAFQTLVNRDLVRPTEKLFICGGGNVGLIGAYHALQAGIDVVGLVEALPECGGYKVHLDKIRRLGVPVYTSHTILQVRGKEHCEEVTICAVDRQFKPIAGTEKAFSVDTLLIAVGLSPVDELYRKALTYGMKAFAAGDAEEIAEASAAMFSGRITGRKIVRELKGEAPIQKRWDSLVSVLRGKPGSSRGVEIRAVPGGVYPIFWCVQEIPCNPCRDSCPKGAIRMDTDELTGTPNFYGETCLGCGECVLACPGLAVTLVDETYDPEKKHALITMPFELPGGSVQVGSNIVTVSMEGEKVGVGKVIAFKKAAHQDRRSLMLVEVPFDDRQKVAGFRLPWVEPVETVDVSVLDEDTVICRCERVTKKQIVELIRAGYRDMNSIKAALRTGMGACNGKNCTELILRLFREEGVDLKEVTPPIYRPPDIEVPLGVFAGVKE